MFIPHTFYTENVINTVNICDKTVIYVIKNVCQNMRKCPDTGSMIIFMFFVFISTVSDLISFLPIFSKLKFLKIKKSYQCLSRSVWLSYFLHDNLISFIFFFFPSDFLSFFFTFFVLLCTLFFFFNILIFHEINYSFFLFKFFLRGRWI